MIIIDDGNETVVANRVGCPVSIAGMENLSHQ
jgi:hypothetical protein